MKRGKDDEKIMGPMFPRLHVNDTEKGGPRAPPRNKMALYEQLSIPSQRFNPGVMPLNPSGKVPAASSSQGSSIERSYSLPHRVPPLPAHLAERSQSRQSDGGNLNISLAQPEPARKKVGDEDDFRVPVFNHSGTGNYHSSTQSSSSSEKPAPFIPTNSSRSLKIQGTGDNHPKHVGSTTGVHLRQDVKRPREENLEAYVSSRNGSERCNTNASVQGKIIGSEDKANTSPNQQLPDNAMANLSKLREDDGCLQHETTAGIRANNSQHVDDVPDQSRETDKGNVPHPGSYFSLSEDYLSCKKPGISSDRDKFGSVQMENGDRSNDVSETSVVDSIRVLDVSPDDVVGIIGQKHFWKARRAIVNQQRVFAVQVFELHRLIKVQRLIAGSPNILLEDSTYLGKPVRKVTPLENLTSECVVTPPEHTAHTAKGKDGSEIPNHKMECSAENAIAKTSASSVKNVSQPSTTVPVATDGKMSPWCFNQSMGCQWLVPVMSPSEGLVYKPYTMPGFMGGSVCGGCGPFGPIPMTGNFMNAAYGGSVSHHQGMGVVPGSMPVGHGYFPPYGMPVINPATSGSAMDQMNHFTGSGSNGQNGQNGHTPVDKENFDLQRQASRSVLTQKSRTNPQVLKFPISKDAEIQGSTGSSPCERAPVTPNVQTVERTDALPPVTASPEGAPEPLETDLPTKVIKVVPHNARSATASVARIFQSIQKERKQYDSI